MTESEEPDPPVTTGEPRRIPVDTTELAADLFRPEGQGPHPVVVMAPGFGATKDIALPRFASRFREAGFLVVLFDYRHFGGSGGEPRQLLSIGRQLADWRTALRFARSLPDADPERVALWGTSLSGGHVVRVAADDDRLAAVVSQVPMASGPASALRMPIRSALKVAGAGALDVLRSGLGRQPLRVPIVGSPGEGAVMAMEEAKEGYRRIVGDRPWENRVCARIGAAILSYRPYRHATRVRVPLLVQMGEHDGLTPPGPARRMARKAPRADLRSYPIGHFDIYQGEWFEKAVRDQTEFLTTHLLAGRPAG